MEDDSNKFKLSEEYEINKNNFNYIINLYYSNSFIEFKVSIKNLIQTTSYSKKYSLEELKKSCVFFLLFKSISDIIPNIKKMLEDKKSRDLEINESSKIIKLILIPPIENTEKIILFLPQKEKSKDEIITELIRINADLMKRVEILEKKLIKIDINNDLNKEIEINSSIIKGNEEKKFILECIGKPNIKLEKIYKMSKDGDKQKFHEKCDNKGPTLCLFKIKGKDIRFGGFTSVSWDSSKREKRDDNAFIFSINNKKMFKTTNPKRAIYCSDDDIIMVLLER